MIPSSAQAAPVIMVPTITGSARQQENENVMAAGAAHGTLLEKSVPAPR